MNRRISNSLSVKKKKKKLKRLSLCAAISQLETEYIINQSIDLPVCLEQNYSESRYHFLHSSDGEGCAQMLVEYSASRGFHSEVDMFVAQAVLQ